MEKTLQLQTSSRDQILDITADVRKVVSESGVRDGLCQVYCPHTTAGLAVNEGYDPDVARDVLAVLDRLVPWDAAYSHGEGNSPAHVKAILCGASQTVPIAGGRLLLGTWQAIQFCEFDGPRQRRVVVTVIGSGG